MDGRREEDVKELKRQLQELEDNLTVQERLLQDRNQKISSLSLSVVDAERAIDESEEELREAHGQLQNVLSENRIAHSERERLRATPNEHLPRDEYMRELSEADAGLREMQSQSHSLVRQVETLSGSAEGTETRRRLTLVSLISMLDDLHTSLSHNVERITPNEDARVREVLKAVCELSRERERAIGYCLRKKREVMDIIELKKQRTKEIMLDSQRNLSMLVGDQEKAALTMVEKIQFERTTLRKEVENIKDSNQRLWDALRDTKYSSDAVQGGDYKRETAISASDALRGSTSVEEEKDHLREQLKLFEGKRMKLQRMIDELRASLNTEVEKYAVKLGDIRHEIHTKQREGQKLEDENRKLKSLCDSLAVTLET